MSLVTKPSTHSAGDTILAAETNSNLDTIYDDYNGNITNDNISASAAIADSKLAQITSAGKVSGAAITSLTSVPSGAGELPIANIPSIDEDNMSSDSDTAVPTQQSTKAYVDTQTATTAFSSIEDYGTSASSSTSKSQSALELAYGTLTISGSSSSALSNLNFTSASSYVITATFGTNQTATEAIEVVQSSGSAATIYNHDNQSQAIHWIAIGT